MRTRRMSTSSWSCEYLTLTLSTHNYINPGIYIYIYILAGQRLKRWLFSDMHVLFVNHLDTIYNKVSR